MTDLRDHDCDLLTVGQYLQPDDKHLPVERYWHPDEFAADQARSAQRLGFKHVEAGPFVRSSYHAGEQARAALARPSMPDTYDLAVIGGGPGGYVAAIRAAQLGLQRRPHREGQRRRPLPQLGLHPQQGPPLTAPRCSTSSGAAPIRHQLRQPLGRPRRRRRPQPRHRRELRRRRRDAPAAEQGRRRPRHRPPHRPQQPRVTPQGETIEAQEHHHRHRRAHALPARHRPSTATASSPAARPSSCARRPASIVIVGGGAIGVEFGYLYRSYGAEVTIVELLPHLLPNEDEDVSRQLERSFTAQGITIRTGTRSKVSASATNGVIGHASRPATRPKTCGPSACSSASASAPTPTPSACARPASRRTSAAGSRSTTTAAPTCPASGPSATSPAAAARPRRLTPGRHRRRDDRRPQPAAAGLRPDARAPSTASPRSPASASPRRRPGSAASTCASAASPSAPTAKRWPSATPKASSSSSSTTHTNAIVGWHIIGHNATELLGEATLATALEATTAELAYAVHAHPTLAEAIKEAAQAASGEAIHFFTRRGV